MARWWPQRPATERGLLGRCLRTVEVTQPEPGEAGLREAERPSLLRAVRGVRDRIQRAESLGRPAVDHERGTEPEPGRARRPRVDDLAPGPTGTWRRHRSPVRPTSGCRLVRPPAGLAVDPSPPSGRRRRCNSSAAVSGRRRRRLSSSPGQPVDRLGVTAGRTTGELVGHSARRRADVGEADRRLPVQPEAQARRHVRIDRLPDQVVAELQQHPALVEHSGGQDRLDARG